MMADKKARNGISPKPIPHKINQMKYCGKYTKVKHKNVCGCMFINLLFIAALLLIELYKYIYYTSNAVMLFRV